MKYLLLIISSFALSGCLGMPKTVTPVEDFNINNYLGQWYEIARLDHSFERGLRDVTAEYRLRDDGGVAVINRGYSSSENEWKEAEGKAYFVNDEDEGYLKVSFFGPFYGSYVVFELDHKNYAYAFVSGPNTDYLWLLARTPTVEPEVIARFVSMSSERGFDTSNLIYVTHSRVTSGMAAYH
ncbi:lipocalin family protein [Thaumasiovibrio sp. DFM-14]|uniref:lipocalin family protein n=1 Tax=Thaumasiovibrio sp. DFM-14 TaxID=3384792 RepID=UPI0039A3F411